MAVSLFRHNNNNNNNNKRSINLLGLGPKNDPTWQPTEETKGWIPQRTIAKNVNETATGAFCGFRAENSFKGCGKLSPPLRRTETFSI